MYDTYTPYDIRNQLVIMILTGFLEEIIITTMLKLLKQISIRMMIIITLLITIIIKY